MDSEEEEDDDDEDEDEDEDDDQRLKTSWNKHVFNGQSFSTPDTLIHS